MVGTVRGGGRLSGMLLDDTHAGFTPAGV
jgi:hypothetical protein